MDVDRYRVEPGKGVSLAARDPGEKVLFLPGKKAARSRLEELNRRLEELQELLYAEDRHRLLVVLQAMDAGGKDGTIRHVFDGVNPQGVRAIPFKQPTRRELAHDYLWRVHRETPARGQIVIFNRSHYEDVLVVRVKGLVEEAVWRRRFDQIVEFERMLAEEGTTILKLFLHISRAEQKERFQARLDEPRKRWKFRRGDLADRRLWDQFQQAYEEALSRTSSAHGPWYVIPADRKWYRNLVISEILVRTLEGLDMKYPEPEEDLDAVVVE